MVQQVPIRHLALGLTFKRHYETQQLNGGVLWHERSVKSIKSCTGTDPEVELCHCLNNSAIGLVLQTCGTIENLTEVSQKFQVSFLKLVAGFLNFCQLRKKVVLGIELDSFPPSLSSSLPLPPSPSLLYFLPSFRPSFLPFF